MRGHDLNSLVDIFWDRCKQLRKNRVELARDDGAVKEWRDSGETMMGHLCNSDISVT